MQPQKQFFLRSRRSVGLALLSLILVFITACAAEVDTTVQLDAKLKGTRTMEATFEREQDAIKGGITAIDKSIRKHLPQETGLSYKGLKNDGEDAKATFVLTFSSAEDYEKKISALLKASGFKNDPLITLSNTDSPLVEGYVMEENFSSVDLLGWVADGLVADRVIDESSKGSVFTSGDTLVRFGGNRVETTHKIKANNVVDNGFHDVHVMISEGSQSPYETKLLLQTASAPGAVQEKKIAEYLKTATPEGAEVKDSITDTTYHQEVHGYTMSFEAKDDEELTKKLQQALGSTKNSISIEDGVSPDSGTRIRSTVKATLDCSALCSPKAEQVKLTFETSDAWQFHEGTSNIRTDYTANDEQLVLSGRGAKFELALERNIPLENASIHTELGLDGKISQTQTYELSKDFSELAGEAFEEVIKPAEDLGTYSRHDNDDNTVFTVLIEGDDSTGFNEKVASVGNGAAVTYDLGEGFQIWPDYLVAVARPLTEGALAGGVANPVQHSLSLPMLHSFHADSPSTSSYTIEGNTASTQIDAETIAGQDEIRLLAKGPTLGGVIFLAILALLLVVLGVFAVIFRKRLTARAKSLWERRDEAAERVKAATASAREHTGNVAASIAATHGHLNHDLTPPATAHTDDLDEKRRWSASFHESKLH